MLYSSASAAPNGCRELQGIQLVAPQTKGDKVLCGRVGDFMEKPPTNKPRRMWKQVKGPRSPKSSLGQLSDYGATPISGSARELLLIRIPKSNSSTAVPDPTTKEEVKAPRFEEEEEEEEVV